MGSPPSQILTRPRTSFSNTELGLETSGRLLHSELAFASLKLRKQLHQEPPGHPSDGALTAPRPHAHLAGVHQAIMRGRRRPRGGAKQAGRAPELSRGSAERADRAPELSLDSAGRAGRSAERRRGGAGRAPQGGRGAAGPPLQRLPERRPQRALHRTAHAPGAGPEAAAAMSGAGSDHEGVGQIPFINSSLNSSAARPCFTHRYLNLFINHTTSVTLALFISGCLVGFKI